MKRIVMLTISSLVLVCLLALPGGIAHPVEASSADQQFIVVFSSSAIPNGAVARIQAAGGNVINEIPQVGALIVAADSSFPGKAQRIPRVA